MSNPRRRRVRLVAAALALVAVAVLTLGPQGVIGPARGRFVALVHDVAAPYTGWLAYPEAERLFNTLMFVPLGATVALLLARGWWPVGVFAGLALSTAVEFAQESIPGRVPDPADVVWNTVGAAIGVVVVTLVRTLVAPVEPPGRAGQRGSVTRT